MRYLMLLMLVAMASCSSGPKTTDLAEKLESRPKMKVVFVGGETVTQIDTEKTKKTFRQPVSEDFRMLTAPVAAGLQDFLEGYKVEQVRALPADYKPTANEMVVGVRAAGEYNCEGEGSPFSCWLVMETLLDLSDPNAGLAVKGNPHKVARVETPKKPVSVNLGSADSAAAKYDKLLAAVAQALPPQDVLNPLMDKTKQGMEKLAGEWKTLK